MLLVMLAAIALLAAAPSFLSAYWQTVGVTLMINLILVMSYRLITTMGGWSFAHIAMMGLGAYTMALMTTGGWSFWLAIVAAFFVSALIALVLAFPILRTRAYYFFLCTFAASEAIRQSFIQFAPVTGGTNGIAFVPRPAPIFGLSFADNVNFFYTVLVATVLVGGTLYAIDNARIGRTIKAVAANEDLSASLGINTWRHRTFAFVLGSGIAGFAGAMSGNFNGIINPSDFSAIAMFKLVAAAIVGGTSTFYGPMLGLLFLTLLEELFRNHADWVPLLWGISVLVAVLATKDGLEGLFKRKPRETSIAKEPAGA